MAMVMAVVMAVVMAMAMVMVMVRVMGLENSWRKDRYAGEELKKHRAWGVLYWIRQLFSLKRTRDVFAAVRMCGIACARNVCVCV
jgi:hypothetical protein